MKVGRSGASCDVFPTRTGILGKYLKLGKMSAEAVSIDEVCGAANEEVVTRTLLYGWSTSGRYMVGIEVHPLGRHTSANLPFRPNRDLTPLTSVDHVVSLLSHSMRLAQSLLPVQTTSCCEYAAMVPFKGRSWFIVRPSGIDGALAYPHVGLGHARTIGKGG